MRRRRLTNGNPVDFAAGSALCVCCPGVRVCLPIGLRIFRAKAGFCVRDQKNTQTHYALLVRII